MPIEYSEYYRERFIILIVVLLMPMVIGCDSAQKNHEIQRWAKLNKKVDSLIPTYEKKRALNYSVLDEYKSLAKQEHILAYRLFGINHLNFATSLFHVGVLSRNTDSAKMYLEHSLEIRRRLLGTNHLLVADCYEELFRALPEYQNEVILYKVLDIRKRILSENNPTYISTFTNFALVRNYTWSSKPTYYSKAIHYVKEAISLSEKYRLDFNIRLEYMSMLANLYTKQKKWQDCLQVNKKIISEYKLIDHDKSSELDYCEYLESTAFLLGKLGKFYEADSLYLSAQCIYEKHNAQDFLAYGLILYGRSMLYKKMGMTDGAKRLFYRFIQITKRVQYEHISEDPCHPTNWTFSKENYFNQ